MSQPLVSVSKNSLYRSYWKEAPQGSNELLFRVASGRDVDFEAGFEPVVEAVFTTRECADAYIAQWQPVYPERIFLVV